MTNFNINEEIDRIIDNTFGTANLRCLQSKLCDKLELVDKMLETKKNLDAITYVTTLELIKEVLVFKKIKYKGKILHTNPYELVLSEIEPALDDLTLDSLMLVVDQYKSINEISYGKIKFSKHQKTLKEIESRHGEFQKVISKHKR